MKSALSRALSGRIRGPLTPHNSRRHASSIELGGRIGQPHSLTHPHLLKPGEVTIGISALEYAQRRASFIEQLPSEGIAIFPAAEHHKMTNDIPYRFRQNSDFLYLTGLHEPSAVAVLQKSNGKPHFTLFVQRRDPKKELWDGPRTGVERASRVFGADSVYAIDELEEYLHAASLADKRVYFNDIITDAEVSNTLQGVLDGVSVEATVPIIEGMRLVKSEAELNIMRRAGEISGEAFEEAMKHTRTMKTEDVLDAFLEFEVRKRGAARLAYPPVVAGGISANTLHYVNNDDILRSGDLVLVDAGGEYECYASDITRTWPINGKFSQGQRILYNKVVQIQERCIDLVRQGMTLDKIHAKSVEMTTAALLDLGIMRTQELRYDSYRRFFPHSIGHYLGMDTHDVASIGRHIPFVPGVVVTIEPGLYIPDDPDIPQMFRGVGIRIEDDIVVTKDGPEVLTKRAPKDADHIESLMK